MSTEPLGQTDAEREEYPDVTDIQPVEFEFAEEIGGVAQVDFESDELDVLFAACKISGEESLQFIKRAALERAAQLLEQAEPAPASPAAS